MPFLNPCYHFATRVNSFRLLIWSQVHAFSRPILFVYFDGGPDHRLDIYFCAAVAHLSLSQIGFGLSMCLQNCSLSQLEESYERVMLVLNLKLQIVGLAQAEIPEATFEQEVAKVLTPCLSCVKCQQRTVVSYQLFQNSLSPVKVLLSNIFS